MQYMLLGAVLVLGFANGANDNFKGVATLWGSGQTTYRRALAWATFFTFLGSLGAIWLAHGLAARFSGQGLVSAAIYGQPAFWCAVALGAAATVLVAAKVGLPISTTHALTGALVGAALVAAGPGYINFHSLVRGILFPLLFSPALSFLLTLAIFPLAKRADPLHWFSGAAISFARGLNDTPKMAGVLLAIQTAHVELHYAFLAAAIALGGALGAARIAETLSKKITPMAREQAVVANLVAASLVAAASVFALPVSTTHVISGGIFGIGLCHRREAHWKMVLEIVLAWVSTLPAGAVLAAVSYFLLSRV